MRVSALLSVPIAIQAQEPDTVVSVGDRVRVMTTIFEYPAVGGVLEIDGVAVTLDVGGGFLTVPRTEILGAEVVVGRSPRHVVLGTLVGGSLFALSFALPVDPNDCGDGSQNFCSRRAPSLLGAFFGVAVGGVIALRTNDIWAPVTLGVSPSASLPGRVDVGVSVALSLRAPHLPGGD
jgi:hypothetical protein